MKYIYSFLVLIVLSCFVASCKKDNNTPDPDMGYDYFSYTVGDYRIYQVDSTFYDDFLDSIIHVDKQVMEVFESVFPDAQGRTSIRVERYSRLSDTIEWSLNDVWYATLTNFQAERIEENIRFVRLIFPVRKFSDWDGNAFNIYDPQSYEYVEVDEPYTNAYFSFDSTLTVEQAYTNNLLNEKNQYEIYARHIGLVYKKFKDVEKDFVTGEIVSGTDYSYTLIEYGNVN